MYALPVTLRFPLCYIRVLPAGGVAESGNPPMLSGNEGRWLTLTPEMD